jgi:hypothetical protein
MEDHAPPTLTPADVAAQLAYEFVRCFAAVAALCDDGLGAPGWSPGEVADELERRIARRLEDFAVVFGIPETADWTILLAEAIDNLGNGDVLEPDAVAAFQRPDVES